MHTPLSVVIKRLGALSQLANEEVEYSKNLVVGPGQSFIHGSPAVTELMQS